MAQENRAPQLETVFRWQREFLVNPTLITSSGEGKPGFVESERFEREEEEAQAAVSAAEPGPAGAVVATAPEPEEKEEEKEVKKERGKEIPPEPKEPPKRKAAAKPETSPKPKADPKRTYLQVETRRRTTSPGGTERPAVTLSGSTARGPEPTQTFQVRGLRGQSEVRQGSGPNPSEELELTPRQPSEVPSGSAPWRKSSLKATHGKGFRLRSAQSRQYRNLQGLIRKAKKEGTQVPRSLRKQVKEFGSGRVRTFKRGGTKRTHSESESRHPIRLKSGESEDLVVGASNGYEAYRKL